RVFKVHIQVGDFAPNDPLLTPVWGLIAEAGVPVVIHCGSGPAPGRFTGPEPIAELLGRFPGLRLIVAHMGTPEYSEFLDLAERHPTVSLDTTMAWTDFCEQDAPYPRAEYGRLQGAVGSHPVRQRLPQHPVLLHARGAGRGAARPRRGLAAEGVLGERRQDVRPGLTPRAGSTAARTRRLSRRTRAGPVQVGACARLARPLARNTRRPTAARMASSVPMIRTCPRARVMAV